MNAINLDIVNAAKAITERTRDIIRELTKHDSAGIDIALQATAQAILEELERQKDQENPNALNAIVVYGNAGSREKYSYFIKSDAFLHFKTTTGEDPVCYQKYNDNDQDFLTWSEDFQRWETVKTKAEKTSWSVYWITGEYELLIGDTIEQAFTNRGYGNGVIRAVDTYHQYDPKVGRRYNWDLIIKKWLPVHPVFNPEANDPTMEDEVTTQVRIATNPADITNSLIYGSILFSHRGHWIIVTTSQSEISVVVKAPIGEAIFQGKVDSETSVLDIIAAAKHSIDTIWMNN